MAEKINEIINNVKKEISIVNEVSGLCYYDANNINCDLRKNNINADLYDYLKSFSINFIPIFTLKDLKER